MNEAEWLKRIYAYLDEDFQNEDCAVIKKDDNHYLVITTDALVEKVHFDFSYFTYYQVGYKLGVVNLSDIASTGAKPLWALLTLGDKNLTEKHLEFLNGLKTILNKTQTKLIGGDTVKSPFFFANLTVFGETKYPLLRKGANVEDFIFVSKPLGESSAFLKYVKEHPHSAIPENLKKAHLMPYPEVELGMLLSNYKIASSCIDVSDGLVIDLYRICEKNKVGAIIWEHKIPIGQEATFEDALYGGEDFALLFTVPKSNLPKLQLIENKLKKKLYCIGTIIKEKKIYLQKKNMLEELLIKGFDHFTNL